MSHQVDIIIIGAGVIGLAIASEIAKNDRDIFVIEKNGSYGREQSSRSSEVIHAGLYYEPGSLKARMCLEGNHLLYELCEDNKIGYRKCGKIFVATNQAEDKDIEKYYRMGRDNGAPLKMLSQREMKELEPNMKGISAFISPTSGTVDSYGLMKYYQGNATYGGVQFVYRAEIISVERSSGDYELAIRESTGESSLRAKMVINCAGLHSDRIAAMAGIDITQADYKLRWCKGEYFSVTGVQNRQINHLIYAVPMAISVGVHVCLDVDWRLRLGPLFYYVDKIDYRIDESNKKDFIDSSIMRALPFIEPKDLNPESSGIMAMLQGENEPFRDFIITHEDGRKLPGFINLVGIESPGITSSSAIAKYVSDLVDDIIGGI
jgi:L-2-hydroxyglutarate oxidase LhgO